MKATGIIGLLTSAALLFLLAPILVAQEEQPVHHRSSRPQSISATPPTSAPSGTRGVAVPPSQFRSAPRLESRPPPPASLSGRTSPYQRRFERDGVVPGRTPANISPVRATSPNSSFRAGATPGTSPFRPVTKKTRRKTARANESQAQTTAAKSAATQNTHKTQPPATVEHEIESAAAAASHTPALPPAGPSRAPETAPLLAPAATMPAVAPAPAFARPIQAPGPVSPQTQPTRLQRPVLNDLSEDERTRLHTAHQNAFHDPNLAASRTRYLNARKEFREKLRDALLKADPSVQPILEKIRREKPEDR